MEIDLHKLRENSTYHCVGSQLNPCLEKLEYPRNDIIYVKDLGHGAFGRVFQVDRNQQSATILSIDLIMI